jgi:hypothetical protein
MRSVREEEVVIGARALGEQIYKIMPTYSILLKQLEEIRTVVNIINSQKRDDEVSKRDVNNTIGIFGARGTGKTSVLYTVQEHIHNNKNDIILPLIEPDNFGDNTKIIGSIVGFLKEEGDKILKQLEMLSHNEKECKEFSKYFNKGTLKPNNPLKQIINETIEYHLYTENQYRNLLGQNYEDLATHIKKSSRLLVPDIAFKNKLNELIDEIVYLKQKLNKSEVPSLIFIFIDDIDLKTSKTRELMDALLQYTNHPQIVTVLSGDYEILLESLTIALLANEHLEKIGLNPRNSLKFKHSDNSKSTNSDDFSPITILQRKSNLAHEYLKKVIPSARRHQLVKWNEETIPYFAFGEASLLSQLAKLMESEQSVFSYKNEKNELLPIKNSYKIFDERPRGIVYAYYNLVKLIKFKDTNETQNNNKENLEYKKDLFRYVKTFVDTLILSSSSLLQYQDLFFDKFILWGNDESTTFINYSQEFSKDGNLNLQLLIIGEVVKKQLKNITIDNSNYQQFQRKIFSKLIWKKNKKEPVYQEYWHDGTYPLFHLIKGLVLSMDIAQIMLLIEYTSVDVFDYYYEYWWLDKEKSKKDRFIVLQIAKLIDQYPDILTEMYNKSQIEKLAEVNYAINVLHNLCAVHSEFEKSEQLYRPIFFNDNNKNVTLSEEMTLKYELFMNNLTTIRMQNEYEFNIQSYYKYSDLINGLDNILTGVTNKKNTRIPKIVEQTITGRMYNFGNYIYSKLKSDDLAISIGVHTFRDAYKIFSDGRAGENTKYAQCKWEVHNLIEHYDVFENKLIISFDVFKGIVSSLINLNSNTRAWYGQREARDFMNVLKQQSSIHDRLFSDTNFVFIEENDKLVLKLYAEYILNTELFKEDSEYVDAKIKIKQKLDQAYEEVTIITQNELSDFGLTLEGAESEMDFDE